MTAPTDGPAPEQGKWSARISAEWTVADLETLPGNGLRYEIVDGKLLLTTAQSPLHRGW